MNADAGGISGDCNSHPGWQSDDVEVKFEPVSHNGITLKVVKYPNKLLQMFIQGPFGQTFNSPKFQIPPLTQKGLPIDVKWGNKQILFSMRGKPAHCIDLNIIADTKVVKFLAKKPGTPPTPGSTPAKDFETACGLTLNFGAPYSDTTATLTAAPNVVEYDENPKLPTDPIEIVEPTTGKTRVIQPATGKLSNLVISTGGARLSFELGANDTKGVTVDGQYFTVKLLNVRPENHDAQELFAYEFLVSKVKCGL